LNDNEQVATGRVTTNKRDSIKPLV
jgi:hypothetical protein